MPYYDAKFENSLGTSPEIKAFVVLGHNWAKNSHLVQEKIFFLETFFKWFLCTYCHLVRCKVWKKTFEQILDTTLKFTKVTFIKLLPPFTVQHLIKKTIMYILRCKDVRLTSDQNCPFLTKDNFWENLTKTIFINLLFPFMLQS